MNHSGRRQPAGVWAQLPKLLLAASLLVALGACTPGKGLPTRVSVKAQYRGLENKTAAVLVVADPMVAGEYPKATTELGRLVSSRIATDLPGTKFISPKRVDAFQKDNPHWPSLQYTELVKALGVERIIVIDLVEYTTRSDRGHRHWKGSIIANVGVIEAEKALGNEYAFVVRITSEYPPGLGVDVMRADRETMEYGMMKQFAVELSRRFHDYEYWEQ